jgi:hypothetical protein
LLPQHRNQFYILLSEVFTPTDPYALEKELRRTQALMQLEQKEDLEQFKIKNAKASIAERQQRGLTWYPVAITKEDIGFSRVLRGKVGGTGGFFVVCYHCVFAFFLCCFVHLFCLFFCFLFFFWCFSVFCVDCLFFVLFAFDGLLLLARCVFSVRPCLFLCDLS